jgi:hypothetical protein
MASEQTMLKATFAAALLVLLVTAVTAIASWLTYFDRQQVRAAVIELQKRVAALEGAPELPPQRLSEQGQQK